MTAQTPRKLFVNIPVTDLKRSIAFFTRLGFRFNQQFTDDSATCMIVGEDAYFMLLVTDRFKDFTRKPLCDNKTHAGGIYAISLGSRAEVDEIVKLAVESGGSRALPPQDHGFMYSWSFYDPDDHHFEVFYMDPAHVQPQQ